MRVIQARTVVEVTDTHDADLRMLVEAHGSALRGFVGRLVGNAADADDLTQEVLVRACRGFGKIAAQTDASPRAWLYRIAANVCADHFRWRARQREVGPDALAALVSPASVERVALDREAVERARRLLNQVPPRQRRAFVLRRLRGLGYDEVARAMGGTPEAARANVYQAARRLKRLWEMEKGGGA